MTQKITIIAIITVIIFIFVSVNFHLYRNYGATPAGTKYFGATGFFFDYYQYLSFIRDGSNGRILISSHYISEVRSPVLLHTFFSFSGFIFSPLKLPPHIVYYLIANISLLAFLISLFILAKHPLFYLLLLISGAFPWVSIREGKWAWEAIIPFAQNAYFLDKFSAAPHHLFANTMIVLLILVTCREVRPLSRGLTSIFSILLALLIGLSNPTVITFFIAVFGIVSLWDRRLRKVSILIIVAVLPLLLYYFRVFQEIPPWNYYYLGEKVGWFNVSFWRFLGSQGPLFFTALLSFFYIRKFDVREKLFAVWLILPVVIFPFAGRQIPYSMGRLFTLNLFIPSAFLSAFLWSQLPSSRKIFINLARLVLIIVIVGTGLGAVFSIEKFYSGKFINYYNVYLPNDLIGALGFISRHTRSRSTVLAGENISNLIPAFSDNQTVLGRSDAYPNYGQVKSQVDDVFLRRLPDDAIFRKLDEWNVQYILFGLDHIGYGEFTKKGEIDGIKKVFTSGSIVVAEVK